MYRTSRSRFCVSLLVLTVWTLSAAAQPAKEWTPAQLMQVKRVSGVQVSPDAKRVVYAVREAVLLPGKSEYRTHVYLATADGSETEQLTKGDTSCDDPQWSPNGKWIAYASKIKTGKRNIWLLASPRPTGGEGPGVRGADPIQVTDIKTGVTSFKWSPDSKQIAFTALEAPTAEEEKAKKDKNDARVVDENVKMSRLYVVSAPPKKAGAFDHWNWTLGKVSVSGIGRGGYDWSPDGKKLVYSATTSPSPDDWLTAKLSTSHSGEPDMSQRPSAKGPAEFSPVWSPNGSQIAYVVSDDPPTWAGSGRVHLLSVGGGKPHPLWHTHDNWGRYSELIGWSADAKSVYYQQFPNGGKTTEFPRAALWPFVNVSGMIVP